MMKLVPLQEETPGNFLLKKKKKSFKLFILYWNTAMNDTVIGLPWQFSG